MDALSEVLRHARFSANVTLDATAHEPWCVSVPASDALSRAHLVVEGECMLRTAHGDEATLRAGDFVFLPGGEAHLIGSPLDADAVAFSSLVRTPIAGELLPVRLGRQGAATHWLSLSFMCERHMAEPLLAALPRMMFVDLAGAPPLAWLADELGLVLSASDAPFLGAAATRSRLAELVFVEALARYVQGLPPGGQGWLAGLNDRFVGRTLALVHGRPSEPWTVERLGRLVGLSRSALADRFSDVMGEPIFAFLTRWRLQLAAEALLASGRSIGSIARDAGYESAGAFSAAFKRTFGKPPSVWRHRRRK
ncbi:MAG TPA: AraC family transcriptional regulator [Usitatibacter sp.]|nr:AraC family transcriptional regulator [Usitatibacter sp.]